MNAVSGRNDITEAISGTEWCYKRGLERDKLALSSKLGGKEDRRGVQAELVTVFFQINFYVFINRLKGENM